MSPKKEIQIGGTVEEFADFIQYIANKFPDATLADLTKIADQAKVGDFEGTKITEYTNNVGEVIKAEIEFEGFDPTVFYTK
jgi:hypothetical protein